MHVCTDDIPSFREGIHIFFPQQLRSLKEINTIFLNKSHYIQFIVSASMFVSIASGVILGNPCYSPSKQSELRINSLFAGSK